MFKVKIFDSIHPDALEQEINGWYESLGYDLIHRMYDVQYHTCAAQNRIVVMITYLIDIAEEE